MRKWFSLGVGPFLGVVFVLAAMLLPRSAASDAPSDPPPADAPSGSDQDRADLDLAARLEAANARIRDLDDPAKRQEEVRAEAERLVHEIFPDEYREPEPQRRVTAREVAEGDDPGGEPREETEAERLDRLEHRLAERDMTDAARDLDQRLSSLESRFPSMDKFRIMAQIARSTGPVNLEKLAETSHNYNDRIIEERAQLRVKEILAKPASPPPIPPRPAGVPASTAPITGASAANRLAEGLAARGFKR